MYIGIAAVLCENYLLTLIYLSQVINTLKTYSKTRRGIITHNTNTQFI